MIVIDVGCAPQGPERSIEKLIERFQPQEFYGFDPAFGLGDLKGGPIIQWPNGARLRLSAEAAWTRPGTVQFATAGIDATVMRDKNTRGEWETDVRDVPCFDLARFIRGLRADEIVCKLDCEGAEIPLLEHLHATGMDERLTLLLVEWHDHVMTGDYGARRAVVEQSLRCKIEEWE